jgi:hypothetical protein
VPVLFTETARFQCWLDVEAARAELTTIPAEMPDSSIHGMRIGLCFRRSLISASGHNQPLPSAKSGPQKRPQAALHTTAQRERRSTHRGLSCPGVASETDGRVGGSWSCRRNWTRAPRNPAEASEARRGSAGPREGKR